MSDCNCDYTPPESRPCMNCRLRARQAPPDYVIEAARKAALRSPCQKSKRGVAAFYREDAERMELDSTFAEVVIATQNRDNVVIASVGWNSPPKGFLCDGSAECRRDCAKFCLHAEHRAIRAAGVIDGLCDDLELVHVKVIGEQIAAGGPPSCWQCSREIVDVGVHGVWLYEAPTHFTPASLATGTWHFYTAHDFHCETLKNCGIAGVPT